MMNRERQITSPSNAAPATLQVFAVAWAIYAGLDRLLLRRDWLHLGDPPLLLMSCGVLAVSAWMLCRPSSTWRLLLLVSSVLAFEVSVLPGQNNHGMYTIFAAGTAVTCLIYTRLRKGADESWATAALRVMGPALRVELLVLYFWVFFHKLNRGYFTPGSSCGWQLYLDMSEALGHWFGYSVMPTWDLLRWPAIVGALAIEGTLPLLLWLRPTRKLGLAIGLMFHLMLALHPIIEVASFTLMMFTMYVLFVPEQVWSQALGRWKSSRLGRALSGSAWAMPVIIVAMMMTYITLLILMSLSSDSLNRAAIVETINANVTGHALAAFFVYGFGCWVLFVMLARHPWPKSAAENPAFGPVAAPAVPWVLLVALNGVSPYVGLKTHHNFAMFSNLRTEAGLSNHLIVPANVPKFGYQDDEVRIIESNVPHMPISADGERWTWFEFTRLIHEFGQSGDTAVVYSRNGGPTRSVSRESNPADPAFDPPSKWARFFWLFKAIPADDQPCPCRH